MLGEALKVEDLNVTLKVVTFNDPIGMIYYKHRGKVSKRRFNNIMKMARIRAYKQLKPWTHYAKS